LPENLFEHTRWIFKERKWEKGGAVYQRLFKIKRWKDSLPELGDFIKSIFPKKEIASLDKKYLKKYVVETCRAELCHWSIILTVFLVSFWSDSAMRTYVFLLALVLNLPYIFIQRYNRPRVINLLSRDTIKEERLKKRKEYQENVG
jgi:glycosyl-4,4'-diaponeurosporenoate acyltransferase